MSTENTNIWLNNPLILLKKGQINQIWPKENMNRNEKINAITRLVIILTILGFLVTQNSNFFITGIVTLGIIIMLYYAREYKNSNENNSKLNTLLTFSKLVLFLLLFDISLLSSIL